MTPQEVGACFGRLFDRLPRFALWARSQPVDNRRAIGRMFRDMPMHDLEAAIDEALADELSPSEECRLIHSLYERCLQFEADRERARQAEAVLPLPDKQWIGSSWALVEELTARTVKGESAAAVLCDMQSRLRPTRKIQA